VTDQPLRRLDRPSIAPKHADDVWIAILQAVPGIDRGPEPLDAYTPAIRQLHAMWLLNAEVANGGFGQFFYNGRGVWLDDVISGFEAAGLDAHRLVVIDAADAVVARLDELTAAQRKGSIEAYSAWEAAAGLDSFDDRWFQLPDVDGALDRFVADHESEIWELGPAKPAS
jgi:hypothetical protein